VEIKMMIPATKITILLADDDPIMRAGLRSILSQAEDIEVSGEAQGGLEVQKMVAELRPNILLLDFIMPGPRPAGLGKWVHENYPCTNTLVLTAHDHDAYLVSMMDSGAAGYLCKGISVDLLINAIQRVAHGESVFDSSQISRATHWRIAVGEKLNKLTLQEKKVLELLATGLDNKSIATSLDISAKTVAYHITNLLSKLNVNSRQEATIWALKHLSDDLE
jgi:DNA-binding NarL/FixJ family response regulator